MKKLVLALTVAAFSLGAFAGDKAADKAACDKDKAACPASKGKCPGGGDAAKDKKDEKKSDTKA